ncbi:MAG TPA: MBL fold metallo-hydrolase [Paludibacter sp.]
MNKTLKSILIGLGIIIAILVLILAGFWLKMKSELKNMHVSETKEVVSGVFAIKDSYVNMFMVKDSDNYIAIDAGADIKIVRNELNKLNIDSSKVVAVLFTHCDGDHTAALSMFENAVVYLSRLEEQMINGKTAKMMFVHNSISRKDYNLLEDKQDLTMKNTHIKCIATPGHTPGSMCYVVNSRYLFVGDAFGLKDGKIDRPNKFFSADMKMAVQSLSKIANLFNVQYIFTAHNGYSNDYKKAMTDWEKIQY